MLEGAGSDALEVDLCVIGAGAAGLTVAAGAAQLGARVALVEKGRMGGECLHSGCVPSKALLAAAQAAESARRAPLFGIETGPVAVDFDAVGRHLQETIAAIAPMDSAERFAGLGIRILRGHARFTGTDRILVGEEQEVRARRFVLATGTRPARPEIPYIDQVPAFDNETIFDLLEMPRHLLVMGAGPVGIELAQAFRRLGSDVTMIEPKAPLAGFDPELAEIRLDLLRAEGIRIIRDATITEFESGPQARLDDGSRVAFSHLLCATGRTAATDGLGLEEAGIAHGPDGVRIDRRLRTTNRRVYAIGDVAATGLRLTHAASHQAVLVLRHALFRQPVDWRRAIIPQIVHGEPELAQAGMTEAQAAEAHGRINVLRWPFAENDRAHAEKRRDGLVKIVTDRRGRILGAGIVGAHAGELIQPWMLAIAQRLGAAAMAGLVAPYPSFGEASKRAAGSFFMRRLSSERTRRLVRLLMRLG